MFAKLLRRSRSRRDRQRTGSPAVVAIEALEELQLLSASPLLAVASPLLSAAAGSNASPAATPGQANLAVTNSTPLGKTPVQIAQAYGFNQITFDNRTLAGNGAGQTIAIVDAYVDPNIASDLAKFDSQFGLAAPPSFTQVVQQGATNNSGWDLETALDVEWAHAVAPGANIVLVEANNSSLSSLLSAVNYARNLSNVSVVSMSWGAGEFSSETQYDSDFTTPAGHTGITFVASSGDAGAGTTWPSVSPNVLAVGGTTLTTSAGGTYVGETAWSDSGGGVSSFETEPSFQNSVQSTGKRTTPDVAYDANPNTGFAVYDSVPDGGQSGWFEVGGTSAGAPQWSALIAIADQGRATAGLVPLSNAQATLYSLPSGDFHDITSGSNGYAATSGYDLVTGRGSPVVTSIMRALTGASTSSAQTAVATTSASTPSARPDATTTNGNPVSAAGAEILAVAPSTGGTLEFAGSPAASDVLVPQAASVGPLASVPVATDRTETVAGPAVGSLLATSDAASAGNEFVGLSRLSSTMAMGAPQWDSSSLADVSMATQTSPAIHTADGDDEVRARAETIVANAADSAVSPGAIDAYFATGGLFTEGTAPVAVSPRPNSIGKNVLAGIATSLGLVTFWNYVRAKRRRDEANGGVGPRC